MKHGKSFSREYKSWQQAKDRCFNLNHHCYEKYGGRGITMCQEWKDDFSAFFADMGERPIGTFLERINNDLGYFKENCKWADNFEQSNNRRSNHFVTYKGVTKTVSQWAKEFNVTPQAIGKRVKKYGTPAKERNV